ncbi:hypothetical protein [Pseudomonas mosselii]|uniref:hypothetical protein n=1 Tax=Pseudomonas mosselii TaxID=78327 RepID=UPI0011B83F79|nr:hypothetical protein [Pseudomonas mosselii]
METDKVVASDERVSSKYEALLKAAGFEIVHVWEEVIYFKLISYVYALRFDAGSMEYISFNLGASIDPEKSRDVSRRYELVQFVNSNYKYVKCTFDFDEDGGDSIQFACDLMFVKDSDFTRCVHTTVRSLDNAYISVSAKYPELV